MVRCFVEIFALQMWRRSRENVAVMRGRCVNDVRMGVPRGLREVQRE